MTDTRKVKLDFCTAALACALTLCGCDGNDSKEREEAGSPAANAGPELDCEAWGTKMTECVDALAPLYAKTEDGSKAGRALDGTVDYAAAEKRFKMLWELEGAKLCTGPAQMITPYSKRDPRWRERFVACDAKAACDVWAPCMATAMGELLPI